MSVCLIKLQCEFAKESGVAFDYHPPYRLAKLLTKLRVWSVYRTCCSSASLFVYHLLNSFVAPVLCVCAVCTSIIKGTTFQKMLVLTPLYLYIIFKCIGKNDVLLVYMMYLFKNI